MPKTKHYIASKAEMLDEACELGERFPDMSDEDILDFIREVCCRPHLGSQTVLAHGILMAYEGDVEAARRFLG
jgi:hypothetical protein